MLLHGNLEVSFQRSMSLGGEIWLRQKKVGLTFNSFLSKL